MNGKTHSLLCLIIIWLFSNVNAAIIRDADEDQEIEELESLKTEVNPCEDFYEFVCGNFHHRHPRHHVNEDGVLNEFTILSERIEDKMKEILSHHSKNDEPSSVRKLKTAFKSCISLKETECKKPMPEVALIVNNGGMPILQKPQLIDLKFGWKEIGKLSAEYGVPLLFDIKITPFPISTTDNLIMIEKDTFRLESMAHPTLEAPLSKILHFSKFSHSLNVSLEKMFEVLRDNINPKVEDSELTEGIDEIVTFMNKIQNNENSKVMPLDTTTKISVLQNWTDTNFPGGEMNWTEYLNAVFSKSGAKVDGNTNIYVNSSYVYNVLDVVQNTNQTILKNFALSRILLLFSIDSSNWEMRKVMKDLLEANNRTLYSRNDYCVRQFIDVMPSNMIVGLSFAAGKLYENASSVNERIEETRTMTDRIFENYKNVLKNVPWMDEKSKTASIRKIENLIMLLGLPDEFENNITRLDQFYEDLKIDRFDHYGNMQRLKSFKQAYYFSQMAGDKRRSFWTKSPFDTNAYYIRSNNAISIPLAMIHPIFFGGKSELMDQSRLGTLIGHEITHGFDNSGRTYNENATLGNLWSAETIANFTDRTQCFRKQYSDYYVRDLDIFVNGNKSLNENLADNGGITVSYEAAKPFFINEYSRKWKNFTPEQMFFIGFGTTFCSVEEPSYIKYSMDKGYSPTKYRVNGAVSNMEQFSKAFNCPANTPMNPELKCKLWN